MPVHQGSTGAAAAAVEQITREAPMQLFFPLRCENKASTNNAFAARLRLSSPHVSTYEQPPRYTRALEPSPTASYTLPTFPTTMQTTDRARVSGPVSHTHMSLFMHDAV